MSLTLWALWLPVHLVYVMQMQVSESSSGNENTCSSRADRALAVRGQIVTYFGLCSSHGLCLSKAGSSHKQHRDEPPCLCSNPIVMIGRRYRGRCTIVCGPQAACTGEEKRVLWRLVHEVSRWNRIRANQGTENRECLGMGWKACREREVWAFPADGKCWLSLISGKQDMPTE